MQAIVQDRYGPAEVLELRQVDKPVPADDQVLVRVYAAAVNAHDWHVMRGDPYLTRLLARDVFGFTRPKMKIRGRDFAGRVEAVGRGVTGVHAGDEVYGDVGLTDGAFAEYLRVPEQRVALKPANLTFEQAAAVPLAGSTALLGVRDLGRVQPGQQLLINGASGGVGSFAVQIAKALGAEVTAVCSARNVDLVRSLGADHVVDYTREDFTQNWQRYDVVFDLVGNRSLTALRRTLTPTGTLLLSGGGVSKGGSLVGPFGLMVRAQVLARFIPQRLVAMTGQPPIKQGLEALTELIESGKVTPIIDRTYPLREAPDAIRYLEVEHARAKVVIRIADS